VIQHVALVIALYSTSAKVHETTLYLSRHKTLIRSGLEVAKETSSKSQE